MTVALSRHRAAAAMAFVAQGFGFATVLTHLSDFKSHWGIDDLGVTVILFGVAVLAGAGSGVAGVIAGRRGSATALRVALLTQAVALTVVALAPVSPVFYAGLAVYGLGLGGVDASSNMQAVGLEGLYGRSILTSFHGAWSGGGIAGALLVAGSDRLNAPLAATLLPAAVVAAVVSVAPFLAQVSTAATTVDLAIPWRPLMLLGLALVLFYLADSAASTWSTVYLRDTLLAPAGVAPLAYGAYQATSLISRFAGDQLVRRFGSRAVVRVAAVIAAGGLVLVIAARGPWPAIAGFAVLGAGVAVVAPLTFSATGALAGDVGEERRRRMDAIVARLNLFNYAGFVLGGVLTGLVGGSSLRWGFAVPLVGVLLIVPLAPAFATRSRRALTSAR